MAEVGTMMRVSDLIDAYLDTGPLTKPAKREISWRNDASNLNRHLRPLIGSLMAYAVTRLQAARALKDIIDGKTAGNEKTRSRGLARVRGGEAVARRTRGVATALWNWGYENDYIGRWNPFENIRLTTAPERDRVLSDEEARRFFQSVSNLERNGQVSSCFADAMRLLLLTGARKSEILSLRWSEVMPDTNHLQLPADRTKAGGRNGPRRIYLSPEAIAILQRRHEERVDRDRRFVFPGARGEGPASGLRKPFLRVCADANLIGFRIHDLRHSFASFAMEGGAPLALIGKALGHADLRSTERYTHASAAALTKVAGLVADRCRNGIVGIF